MVCRFFKGVPFWSKMAFQGSVVRITSLWAELPPPPPSDKTLLRNPFPLPHLLDIVLAHIDLKKLKSVFGYCLGLNVIQDEMVKTKIVN